MNYLPADGILQFKNTLKVSRLDAFMLRKKKQQCNLDFLFFMCLTVCSYSFSIKQWPHLHLKIRVYVKV